MDGSGGTTQLLSYDARRDLVVLGHGSAGSTMAVSFVPHRTVRFRARLQKRDPHFQRYYGIAIDRGGVPDARSFIATAAVPEQRGRFPKSRGRLSQSRERIVEGRTRGAASLHPSPYFCTCSSVEATRPEASQDSFPADAVRRGSGQHHLLGCGRASSGIGYMGYSPSQPSSCPCRVCTTGSLLLGSKDVIEQRCCRWATTEDDS